MRIGILGALAEEIQLLHDIITVKNQQRIGGRIFYEGTINNTEVVLAQAKIGKVATAITTTILLQEYDLDAIIFTGVAGALSPELNIGDIVIATELIQHDMDATPIFPKYQIPLLNTDKFKTSETLTEQIEESALNFIKHYLPKEISANELATFGIKKPQITQGTIVSGDQFVSDAETTAKILAGIPKAKCVEMEGAAMAQVCYEFGTPFSVIRTISDNADHSAEVNYLDFLNIASHYSKGIMADLFKTLHL